MALSEFYISGESFPQGSSGGIVGKFIFLNLVKVFGLIGSLLFLVIFLIPSLTLALNIHWPFLFSFIGKLIFKLSTFIKLMVESSFKLLEKLILALIRSLKSFIQNLKNIQKNKQTQPLDTKSAKSIPKKTLEIKTIPKTQSVINLKNEKPDEKIDLSNSDMSVNEVPITKMPSTELLDRALDDGCLLYTSPSPRD